MECGTPNRRGELPSQLRVQLFCAASWFLRFFLRKGPRCQGALMEEEHGDLPADDPGAALRFHSRIRTIRNEGSRTMVDFCLISKSYKLYGIISTFFQKTSTCDKCLGFPAIIPEHPRTILRKHIFKLFWQHINDLSTISFANL